MTENLPTITDWISSISSTLSTCLVAAGALVAWKQLSAWRDQAKSEKRVRAAEQILMAAFEVKDAMASARRPLMSVPVDKASDPKYIYRKRFELLLENKESFEALRLGQISAKILAFDTRIEKNIELLFQARIEFWNALELLADYAGERVETQEEKELIRDSRRVTFARFSPKDELTEKIENAVSTLEVLLGEIIRSN